MFQFKILVRPGVPFIVYRFIIVKALQGCAGYGRGGLRDCLPYA